MELIDIVRKLIGPVDAVGDTTADARRLENLRALTDLTDRLLGDINRVSSSADRTEASMKKIGVEARDFLRDVRGA